MAKLIVLGFIPGTHIQITFYGWLLAGLAAVGTVTLIRYGIAWYRQATVRNAKVTTRALDPELIAL